MAHALAARSPIDGDPDLIRAHADELDRVAQAIRLSAQNLESLVTSEVASSAAVDAFIDVASDVRQDLDAIDGRYDAVAGQLREFSSELGTLQDQARSVMDAARSVEDEASGARVRAEHLRESIAASPHDPTGADQAVSLHHLEAQVAELHAVIDAYDGELGVLVDRWREAAARCAGAIRDAVDGSPLHDSTWDRALAALEHGVQVVLPLIEIVLDVLAVVLTIAAVLVALTGVGAALAPALFAVARLATVASKVARAVRAALTTVLVCAGRASPMALVALGVDAAVGKVGGKVADAAVGATVVRLPAGGVDRTLAAFAAAAASIPPGVDAPRTRTVVALAHGTAVSRVELVAETAVDVFPGFGLARGLDEGLTLTTAWYPREHSLNGWSLVAVDLRLDIAALYGRAGMGPDQPTSVGGLLRGDESSGPGTGAVPAPVDLPSAEGSGR